MRSLGLAGLARFNGVRWWDASYGFDRRKGQGATIVRAHRCARPWRAAQFPSSCHLSATVVIDGRGRAGLRATAALRQLAGQYRSSGAHTLGACWLVPGTGVALGRGFWPVCGVGTLPGLPPLATGIRPFPFSLTRDLLLATCGSIFMSSPRYHPQKETLLLGKRKHFFYAKNDGYQYGQFLGNMFPISNNMFPRILESPKRFSLPPACRRSRILFGGFQSSTPTTRSGRRPATAARGSAIAARPASPK